jgi:hypothetical protein
MGCPRVWFGWLAGLYGGREAQGRTRGMWSIEPVLPCGLFSFEINLLGERKKLVAHFIYGCLLLTSQDGNSKSLHHWENKQQFLQSSPWAALCTIH